MSAPQEFVSKRFWPCTTLLICCPFQAVRSFASLYQNVPRCASLNITKKHHFLYRILTLNSLYLSGYDLEILLQNNHNQSHAYNSVVSYHRSRQRSEPRFLRFIWVTRCQAVENTILWLTPFECDRLSLRIRAEFAIARRETELSFSPQFVPFADGTTCPRSHQAAHKQNRKVIILI